MDHPAPPNTALFERTERFDQVFSLVVYALVFQRLLDASPNLQLDRLGLRDVALVACLVLVLKHAQGDSVFAWRMAQLRPTVPATTHMGVKPWEYAAYQFSRAFFLIMLYRLVVALVASAPGADTQAVPRWFTFLILTMGAGYLIPNIFFLFFCRQGQGPNKQYLGHLLRGILRWPMLVKRSMQEVAESWLRINFLNILLAVAAAVWWGRLKGTDPRETELIAYMFLIAYCLLNVGLDWVINKSFYFGFDPLVLQSRDKDPFCELERRFGEPFARWMDGCLKGRRVGAALDLGCGGGWFVVEHLAKGADQAYGIDLDPKKLSEAQSRLAESTEVTASVGFVHARIEQPPFRERSFDLIVGMFSFHKVAPDDLARSIDQILSAKGEVLFVDVFEDHPPRHPRVGLLRRELTHRALRDTIRLTGPYGLLRWLHSVWALYGHPSMRTIVTEGRGNLRSLGECETWCTQHFDPIDFVRLTGRTYGAHLRRKETQG